MRYPSKTLLLKLAILVLGLAGLAIWLHATAGSLLPLQKLKPSATTPPVTFFFMMLILPLAGFPISVFLLLSGAVFGLWKGIALTTAAAAGHLVFSYWIGKSFLRARISAGLQHLGYSLPDIPQTHLKWVTFVYFLLPGLPYAVKNYSFALTNVSFPVFFFCGLPAIVTLNVLFIVLGRSAASANWMVFGAAAAVVLLGYAALFKMRNRFHSKEKAASPEGGEAPGN